MSGVGMGGGVNALHERIAEWAGVECRCDYATNNPFIPCPTCDTKRHWGNCPRHSNGSNPPDYSRDEVAVGLIPILLNRGYVSHLNATLSGDFNTYDYFIRGFAESICQPTIAAAIVAAVSELIERYTENG